jgi:hypothetical protein
MVPAVPSVVPTLRVRSLNAHANGGAVEVEELDKFELLPEFDELFVPEFELDDPVLAVFELVVLFDCGVAAFGQYSHRRTTTPAPTARPRRSIITSPKIPFFFCGDCAG